MIAEEISSKDIKLVAPNVERDVPLGLIWTAGEEGKHTLRLMGNIIDDDFTPSNQEEIQRYKAFIEKTDQINWMIEYKGQVVGTVWVDLSTKNTVKHPSVHIMIGDKSARGKGIGLGSIKLVLSYLKEKNYAAAYSRTLITNKPMQKIFYNLGFVIDKPKYRDKDGLIWQNYRLRLE